jgi:regulator of sirC expression with transglutaminase-like and TPR domain
MIRWIRPSLSLVLVLAGISALSRAANGQLAPKRALSATSTLPCPAAVSNPIASRNDSPDVRRLMSLGHEAAIVGDHRQARDVFVDAARLSPGDERIAYQLGRAYEELGEKPNAVREYCRFLALAPNAADAVDVRSRITALTASANGAPTPGDQAANTFRLAVAHLDQRRWRDASDAFGRVIQTLPRAPEPYYDRAIALSALQQRDAAAKDFEQYLALRPGAEDQAQVRAQIDALRRPTWSTSTALVTGLVLPGLGQAYTSRPWMGLGVAAVAGGSLFLALQSKDEPEIRDYTVKIPGFPDIVNIDTVTVTKHPYYAAGLAAFTTLTIGAAFEAARYARRSQTTRAPSTPRPPAARVGSMELFAPNVVPTRNGFGILVSGHMPLPRVAH